VYVSGNSRTPSAASAAGTPGPPRATTPNCTACADASAHDAGYAPQRGDGGVLRTVIARALDGTERALPADVLLPFYGLASDLGPLKAFEIEHDGRQIIVDPGTMATSRAGVHAIGDIAAYPGKLKLILTGFAEAACATHAIWRALNPDRALHFQHSTDRGAPGF